MFKVWALKIRKKKKDWRARSYLNILQKWWANKRVEMRMPILWRQVPSRMRATKSSRKRKCKTLHTKKERKPQLSMAGYSKPQKVPSFITPLIPNSTLQNKHKIIIGFWDCFPQFLCLFIILILILFIVRTKQTPLIKGKKMKKRIILQGAKGLKGKQKCSYVIRNLKREKKK